jgi:molybdenum cofactor guanylyltransferase
MVMSHSATLPIHGFVLAGGRSSRMGRDKALLAFRGRQMIQIAVDTLTEVCERVSIAGNREDLANYAPVVREARLGEGPVAGIEAGLASCSSPWALFMPVDLPLLSPSFIRAWAQAVVARPATRASYICSEENPHPALCMLRRECFADVSQSLKTGTRRVKTVLEAVEGLWVADARALALSSACECDLTNVNTPDDLALTEKARSSLALIDAET